MDYGIKISQSGSDVKTCNKENLVFSSAYDTLKLCMSGSGSKVIAAGNGGTGEPGKAIVTIEHKLGYKPAFIVFCTSVWRANDKFSPYAYKSIGALSPDGGQYAVDELNLYLYLYNGDTSQRTIYYKYHIYYNELNE
jgi:hypothetical protein